MSFKRKLREASFRNVSFHVPSHNADMAGRRVVAHEYPNRDVPYVEDMGLKSSSFALEAYVIGDDYMRGRDQLIAVCSEAGSGELIHPYLGAMEVICTGCNFAERSDEKFMARFSLKFIKAGENKFPGVSIDSAFALKESASNLLDEVTDLFTNIYQPDGVPAFVTDSAVQLFSDIADSIMNNIGSYGEAKQVFDRFIKDIPDVIFNAKSVAENYLSFMRDIADSASDKNQLVIGLVDAGNSSSGLVPGTTPARKIEASNEAAISLLAKAATLALKLDSLPEVKLATSHQAFAYRDSLMDSLDELEDQASNEHYHNLGKNIRESRNAMLEHIKERAPKLARLTNLSLNSSEPALVTSYRLYHNLDEVNDLVARNNVAHPSFMPATRLLEVISYG